VKGRRPLHIQDLQLLQLAPKLRKALLNDARAQAFFRDLSAAARDGRE
jgi:hypothetical protein